MRETMACRFHFRLEVLDAVRLDGRWLAQPGSSNGAQTLHRTSCTELLGLSGSECRNVQNPWRGEAYEVW
jgi:hypothetical protein